MPTSVSTRQASKFFVAVFGIPAFEQQIIARIFALTAARDRSFELALDEHRRAADIMFVDMDDATAVRSWEMACATMGSKPPPTIWVADDKLKGKSHYVQRPFIASRLLKVFDEVVERHFGGATRSVTSTGDSSGEVESLRQRVASIPLGTRPRYKALVVDDSLAVRKQVGMALARVSIDADYADSGEAALLQLEQAEYDIVFLDVVMPGMDGYEVCKRIKRDRRRKHMPVVMLTGKSSPFDRVRGKLSGCNSYLTKPVAQPEFMRTIARFLKYPARTKSAI